MTWKVQYIIRDALRRPAIVRIRPSYWVNRIVVSIFIAAGLSCLARVPLLLGSPIRCLFLV